MKTTEIIKSVFLFLIVSLFVIFPIQAQSFFNLGFEYKLNDKLPVNWESQNADTQLDSINKIEGEYALQAIRTEKNSNSPMSLVFQKADYIYGLQGKKVDFKSKIKTDFKNTEGKACAFIQAISMQYPEKKKIIFGNQVGGNTEWEESSVSYQIEEDYIPDIIMVGVLFTVYGKVYMDDCEILLDNKPISDMYFRKETLSHKEIQWIDKHAISVVPEIKDKKKFIRDIGNSRIVGLGEPTHGSASVVDVKNNLAKVLIEEGDFTLFAIEDGAEVAERFNQYVLGNSEKLPDLNMNMMYANTHFLEFIEWVRDFNQSGKQKVRIVSPDIKPQDYKAIAEDLDVRTQKQFSSLLSHINETLKKNFDFWGKQGGHHYLEMSLKKDEKELIENGIRNINHWIDKNVSDENEKTTLFLYTRNIIQLCSISKTMRDKAMADNIQWLLERNPNDKIIYTAHNSHVANNIYKDSFYNLDKSISKLPLFRNIDFPNASPYAGWYLKQYFGNDYYVIGISFYEGTNLYSGIGVTETSKANPGSYEYLLNRAKSPAYFLDLQKIKTKNIPEAKWLLDKMLLRDCGSTYLAAKEFIVSNLSKEFDAIVFLKNSVAL